MNYQKQKPEHLSFYEGMEKSQWWSLNEIESYQFHHLKRLLDFTIKNNTYYQDRLAPYYSADTKLNLNLWRQLPILKREDVQKAGDQLFSHNVPANHGKVNTISTSGSTGAPITIKKTALSNKVWLAQTLRDHKWHHRDLEAKLAIIRIFENNIGKAPSGTKSKGWGPATNIINNKGTSYLLDINTPINSQVGWLLEVKPHYILSYPNNLKALAEYFIKHDLSLDSLKEVRTLGEVVDNEIHEFCSKAWKVKLNDVYSAQETGYIAIQCSENTNYHIQCENAYVEILNEKDDPCKPGEIGRVIVTPLHNFATPLIRYEIGDYAKVGEPCSCGRGLPVLKTF